MVLMKQNSLELKLSPYMRLLVKTPSHSDGKNVPRVSRFIKVSKRGKSLPFAGT